MADKKRSVAFVLSDSAAQDDAICQALASLPSRGHDAHLFSGDRLDAALASPADVLVAVGGDGTLSRVVAGVVKSGRDDLAIGVLPGGTGNDFATGCGILANDLEANLQMIADAEPRRIDVGTIDGRPFVNVVSGGFGAEVTAQTSAGLKAILGKFAYSVTGLAKVFESADRQAVIRGADFEWKGALHLFSVANGRLAGGGYHVAPEALLDDGLLDVLIVPTADLLESPALIIEFLSLGTTHPEHIKSFRSPWVEVETPSGVTLSIDGESAETTSFRIECLERTLPIILPGNAPFRK